MDSESSFEGWGPVWEASLGNYLGDAVPMATPPLMVVVVAVGLGILLFSGFT